MIYLDTSVALAQLLSEDRYPPPSFWRKELVSSRLLEYEAWTRIHSHGLSQSHSEPLSQLLSRIAFVELARPVLARATESFPIAVRTLDALHLASAEFLHSQGQKVTLASYDSRMLKAAHLMGLAIVEP